MNHAHGILDRHPLETFAAVIFFGSTETGKNQRVTPMDKMTAVELRADLNSQIAILNRGKRVSGVRDSPDEISSHPDEDLNVAPHHGWNHSNRIEPMLPRRLDPARLIQTSQPLFFRAMINSAGAVALDIRVATNRARTGAFAANIAAHQQHVHGSPESCQRRAPAE
jgi:hypothetical protein